MSDILLHLAIPLGMLLIGVQSARCQEAPEPTFYQRFGDPEITLPGDQDQPFRGRIAAHLDLRPASPEEVEFPPPAAFAPRADGSVLLLQQHPPRLLCYRGEEKLFDVALAGAGFRPESAALIDLLPFGKDKVLLLDQAGGTLWISDLTGKIEGRKGLFLAPQSVRQGSEGSILVDDPGNQAIAVFQPDLEGEFTRKGNQIFPACGPGGSLAFLRERKDMKAVLVGQIPARGANPEPDRLAVLTAPEGQIVLDSQVVGWHQDVLSVVVRSAREDDQWPRQTAIWSVPTGAQEGPPQARVVPTITNYCTDCGPELRQGPKGGLWRMVLARGEYWILELEEGTNK